MLESTTFSLFLVGLLGGVHCVGMCGGIVGALSLGGGGRWSLQIAYNLGRISSYTMAGALAGLVGAAALSLDAVFPIRLVLYGLANAMLLALGLYLMGFVRVLALTEQIGQGVWRHLQPLTRRFIPARTPMQAFPLGLLWGWLPCGLVYSAVAMALTTGSAAQGALSMLAFGLGTLPNLLLAGLLLRRMQGLVRHAWVRRVAGAIVLAFGLYGLLGLFRMLSVLRGIT